MSQQVASLYASIGLEGATTVKQGLADVKGEMGATQKASGGVGGALTELTGILKYVTVGAAAFGGAWKVAMDFGKQGATIMQLNSSFEQMMGSAEKAAAAEQALGRAVNNTMTGEQIEASILRMLTGAEGVFADKVKANSVSLFEMAAASAKINPTLGSTNDILQAMAQSLEMGTTRGLKRMGIVIDQSKAETEYAASIGKTKDQLSEEERKVAVLNGALEYHDTLLRQAGGSTENLIDPFKRLETAVEETGDKLKTLLAPGLANAAEAAALLITWNDRLSAAQKEHAGIVLETSASYEEYIAEIARAQGVLVEQIDAEGNLTDSTNGMGATQKRSIAVSREQYDIQRQVAESTKSQSQAIDRAAEGLIGYNTNVKQVALSTEELKKQTEDLQKAYQAYTADIVGSIDKTFKANDAQAAYNAQMKDSRTEIAKLEAENAKLAKSNGVVIPLSMKGLEDAYVHLGKAMDDQKKHQAGATAEVAKWDAVIKGTGPKQYIDNSKEIQKNKEKILELKKAEAERAEEHNKASKQIILDTIKERFAVGGWTEQELTSYSQVAVNMGLMTKQQAAQALAQAAINKAYDEGTISAGDYAKAMQDTYKAEPTADNKPGRDSKFYMKNKSDVESVNKTYIDGSKSIAEYTASLQKSYEPADKVAKAQKEIGKDTDVVITSFNMLSAVTLPGSWDKFNKTALAAWGLANALAAVQSGEDINITVRGGGNIPGGGGGATTGGGGSTTGGGGATTTTTTRTTSGGKRAIGGPVMAGVSYIVGEPGSGPELFIPDVSGRIIPNRELQQSVTGATGGSSIYIAPGAINVNAAPGQNAKQIADAVIVALAARARAYRQSNIGALRL